jgi:hypothetical protein
VTKDPDCSKDYLQKITNGEETPIDEETNTRNEVKEYLDTQYIYPFDSCWRTLGFEIHRTFLLLRECWYIFETKIMLPIVLKLIYQR